MSGKNLHHIRPPKQKTDGNLHQVFHRRGKLYVGVGVVQMPDKLWLPITTESEKITSYGAVLSGDEIVPYASAAAKTLSHSLRVAVGTHIMTAIEAHPEPPAFAYEKPPLSVYGCAIDAMQNYGSANQKEKLDYARQFIRSMGFRHQAKLLEMFIVSAINLALERDIDGLNWLYTEFHSLYGNDEHPNPQKKPKEPEKEKEPEPGPLMKEGGVPNNPDDAAHWGTIVAIERVPMQPWKHPKMRTKKSWKYSEYGVFKYPWRALPSSDLRCFSMPRKQYGGTILIDFSGSMSIDQAHIDTILNAAPYATIAAYSGNESRMSGKIIIIAENCLKGFAVDARSRLCKANVIDGPALEWLAQQEKPRIWISDGHVTGVGDYGAPKLFDDAARICQAGQIIRIASPAALIQQLSL